MKKLLFTVFLLSATLAVFSQDDNNSSSYNTAVGVKVYPGAITVKHFIKNNIALEGIGYFDNGFWLTGLYEIHTDIKSVEGLKWYIGPGAHLGSNNQYNTTAGNTMVLGIDGIIGLDYKIKDIPLNVSFDWQPSFTLLSNSFFRGYGGLAIRYAF